MTMRKLHEFAPGTLEQTIWAAKQAMGEEISQGKNPIKWVMFFADIAETYGEL